MTNFEMVKYHNQIYPKGIHLRIEEIAEYGGLELTAEAARFYTSGRARFTPPGGHILQ